MNKKDLILDAMISNTERNAYFSYKSLKKSLFKELNIDQVKFLIDTIILEKPELIKRIENPLDDDLIQHLQDWLMNF